MTMERKRERFSCSKYGVRVVNLDNEELLLNALQLTLQMRLRSVCRDRAKWIGKQTLMWLKRGLCVKITQSASVHLVLPNTGIVTCWNARWQEEHLMIEIITTFSNKYICQINVPFNFTRYDLIPCLESNMKQIQQCQKRNYYCQSTSI